MKAFVKSKVKRLIEIALAPYVYAQRHIKVNKEYFSHYGEDVILEYVFKKYKKGFYVDVGCYHPDLFPNTKKLFLSGWRGINIDANKDTMDLFQKARPNDINLNYAIAEKEGDGEYFKFTEFDSAGGGSGNSLSEEVKKHYEKQGLKAKTVKVKMKTLATILSEYAPNQVIDFMNVDVEGFDLQVLKSNDWKKFRPKVLAVEIWHKDIDFDNTKKNDIYQLLKNQGYKPFSCAIHTWFFYDTKSNISIV